MNKVLVDHLQCDHPAQAFLNYFVNHGHASMANHPDNFILVAQCLADKGIGVGA